MSADHNISDASFLLMFLDFKFVINFKNSTENATVLNVIFLFVQNTLYKIRPYLSNRFTIDHFFLSLQCGWYFLRYRSYKFRLDFRTPAKGFLYLTRKHVINIFRYFWNGILSSDYASVGKIMKKYINQVHFYRFWHKRDVLHRCTIVSICRDLRE